MIRAWMAGDCWLKPGAGPVNLAPVWGESPPAVFVVNLEGAVAAGPARPDRRSLLPLDAGRLPELAVAGKTVCVLANNHVTDYGSAGVIVTLEEVRRAGFLALGAGTTLSEARKPVTVEAEGRRIGLLAYADTRPHVGAVPATDRGAGVAPLDPEMIVEDLRRLSASVDDVWLFLHWGREYFRYPEPEQRTLARAFAEAGADLIVGIHPHVLQGSERIGDTPVYYSLGNFVFPPIPLADHSLLRWDGESRQGAALQGTLGVDGWCWAHVPYRMSASGGPSAALGHDREARMQKLTRLSRALDKDYARRYPRLHKQERVLSTMRRLRMMTWAERLRLPGRLIRRAAVDRRGQTITPQ